MLRLFGVPCRLIGPVTEKSFHALTIVFNENEDCEGAIVEQIAAKHQKTSEYQETDEDDMTESKRVTNQDARKLIAILRL
jgi:hypothetical protein